MDPWGGGPESGRYIYLRNNLPALQISHSWIGIIYIIYIIHISIPWEYVMSDVMSVRNDAKFYQTNSICCW